MKGDPFEQKNALTIFGIITIPHLLWLMAYWYACEGEIEFLALSGSLSLR